MRSRFDNFSFPDVLKMYLNLSSVDSITASVSSDSRKIGSLIYLSSNNIEVVLKPKNHNLISSTALRERFHVVQ